jgi:bifunctional non-homologous end joining protein LigD
MTELVPEVADLPPRLVLDGELIAFGEDGLPSFPRLCARMLHRRRGIPIAYMIFDLLEENGRSGMHRPYWQRRRRLDKLDLRGSHWQTSETFHDGAPRPLDLCASWAS